MCSETAVALTVVPAKSVAKVVAMAEGRIITQQ